MAFKLSQIGGNDPQTVTSGTLKKGFTYEILDFKCGDDFIIGGATDNNVGTKFISNGIQPDWCNSSEIGYNLGSPFVTVDINEVNLDRIWFEFLEDGNFLLKSKGLFNEKTALKHFMNTSGNYGAADLPLIYSHVLDENTIHIETVVSAGGFVNITNDMLFNAYFELDIN